NINQTIVRRLSSIEMFQEACTVAVRDGGFGMAWIGLIQPDGRYIKTMASAGDTSGYIEDLKIDLSSPGDRGPTAQALRTAHHAICHDVLTDHNIKNPELAVASGFRSIVALPLMVNGSVVGNFSLYSSVLGIFNQREMDLLDELASDISFSLSVAEVEIERELAEKALRESETLFHTLARSSPVGVFHTNLKGDFLYINQSWFEITGISFQDAMNNGWFNGIYQQDREKITTAWQTTVAQRQAFNQEFRFQRADSSIVWVKGQAAVEQDATGHFLGYVGTVTDITALKINEENHRMSNAVFENTREGIMVTDVNNRIVMINRACTDITQYQGDELIGMTPGIVASGRHDRAFYADMWDSLKTTGHWQGELWNRRKNGDVYPELLSISAIKNESGEVTNYVGVFADISSLKSSEEKLEFLAHHDPLTKLPNRLMLLSRLDHAIEVARRDGTQLALLMLDLDRFKNVNDSFGHLAGDELLQQVAQRLTSKLRGVDTVTRLGGDEFTVLLGTIASPEDAARVAASIIKSLEAPWSLSNNIEVRIGASIGISLFPGHGESALELLQHADAALYQAKAAGRGCARYFSEKLTQAARDRFNIESRLRLAIQNDELKVYYQPKIDIMTGKIIGAEALMRWQDPVDGLMMPTRFISIAEDTGLIRGLGEWVIRETCEQGKRWLDAGIAPLKLAVNISAHQLHHTDIFKTLSALLSETGFPPEHLELELTESILMNREAEVVETLNTIRAKGITLAIDDFGTGYSSLSYLKSFPLDVLKIDRSFIYELEKDEDDRAITATIIKIAHTLGMQVVAEGVETEAQLTFLRLHQCDMYQGFLTSHALAADEFSALLVAHNTST
ncbi:MAG: EAL domain-containing protein, partial [Methylophilaceae bacterium]